MTMPAGPSSSGTPARLRLVAVLAAVALVACGTTPRSLWPFGAKPAPAPLVADEIVFEAAAEGLAAPVLPQVWKRNTLIIDMQGLSGSGAVRMRAKAEEGWPFRIALRVRPGSFERVEFRADQRAVLAVDPAGTGPLDLELAPGVHSARTAVITLAWGPASAALVPSGPAVMSAPAAAGAVQSPPGS